MIIYITIVVPVMAIMCGVCLWVIGSDIRAILRSMKGEEHTSVKDASRSMRQAA